MSSREATQPTKEEVHEGGFEDAHKLGLNIRRSLTKKTNEFQKSWSTPSTPEGSERDTKTWGQPLDEVRLGYLLYSFETKCTHVL